MVIPGLTDGAPLALLAATVESRRCNVLGHMRAAEYVALFDDAFLAFIRITGLTGDDLRHGTTSPFLLDLHATYLRELSPGDDIAITAQILDADDRRARVILLMQQVTGAAPALAATCELAILNVDMAARRPVPWSPPQAKIWGALGRAHASVAMPPQAGRAIGPLGPR